MVPKIAKVALERWRLCFAKAMEEAKNCEVIEFYRVEKCRGFAGCIRPTELKQYNLFAEIMHLHRFHSLRFVLCSMADNLKCLDALSIKVFGQGVIANPQV